MVRRKPDNELDPARAWALENGFTLPKADLRPVAGTSINEETHVDAEAAERPERVNKKDMLRLGFDPDVGRVVKQAAEQEPNARTVNQASQDLARWEELAGQVADRLRVLLATLGAARHGLATRGVSTGSRHLVEDAPGLAELERLSSALWPWGWEAALEHWFSGEAELRIERKARPLWEGEKRDGKLVLVLGPSEPFSAEAFLSTWRQQETGRAGHVPAALTPELLDAVAELVNRGGGRAGGYTPARAVELVKLGARDPGALRSELAKVTTRKAKRAAKEKQGRAKQKP